MKLYIKQKFFSWNDKFTVKDEYGADVFFVEGELFTWGKKLHVYDSSGEEVVFISEKVWSFLCRYAVNIGGEDVCEVVRNFTFFRPSYSIEGLGWEVDGSFWEHEYEITDSYGRRVASISKEWMTWGDSYELEVFDTDQLLTALAVVIIIDCVVAAQSSN